MADDTDNTDIPQLILDAVAAAKNSDTIVLVKDRLPATLFLSTGSNTDIPVKFSVDGGATFAAFAPAQVLSDTTNAISIYGPMTLRLDKPVTTTNPVKVYLQYRRP